jgi:hypothetical protein
MHIYVSQTVKKNSSVERVTGLSPKGLDIYIFAHSLRKKEVLFEEEKKKEKIGRAHD